MAVPEWYSGTDGTGRVAAGIEAVIERMDERVADHGDIVKLEELLKMEEEVNWGSFILGLIGTIHYDLDEVEAARRVLQESINGYKIFLKTFDEVLSVYCQTCYTLGVILHDAQKFGDAAGLFLRCLPYMHEVYEDAYAGNVYTYLDTCLSRCGQPTFSVPFSEAAAYSRNYDCESLEKLMLAYGNDGHIERATEVFHMLASRCQDYEDFDRVLDYARRNLGESGVVN